MNIRVAGPGPAFHLGFVAEDFSDAIRNYRDVVHRFDMTRYREFCQALSEEGVRVIGRGIWYISTAHSESDIEQAVAAVDRAFQRLGH